jgi:hypothetical protein
VKENVRKNDFFHGRCRGSGNITLCPVLKRRKEEEAKAKAGRKEGRKKRKTCPVRVSFG